jgi:hypothetical protein
MWRDLFNKRNFSLAVINTHTWTLVNAGGAWFGFGSGFGIGFTLTLLLARAPLLLATLLSHTSLFPRSSPHSRQA